MFKRLWKYLEVLKYYENDETKVWNVQIVVKIGQQCCLCCTVGCLEIA